MEAQHRKDTTQCAFWTTSDSEECNGGGLSMIELYIVEGDPQWDFSRAAGGMIVHVPPKEANPLPLLRVLREPDTCTDGDASSRFEDASGAPGLVARPIIHLPCPPIKGILCNFITDEEIGLSTVSSAMRILKCRTSGLSRIDFGLIRSLLRRQEPRYPSLCATWVSEADRDRLAATIMARNNVDKNRPALVPLLKASVLQAVAAVSIQCQWRGYRERKRANFIKRIIHTRAAVLIQRTWRFKVLRCRCDMLVQMKRLAKSIRNHKHLVVFEESYRRLVRHVKRNTLSCVRESQVCFCFDSTGHVVLIEEDGNNKVPLANWLLERIPIVSMQTAMKGNYSYIRNSGHVLDLLKESCETLALSISIDESESNSAIHQRNIDLDIHSVIRFPSKEEAARRAILVFALTYDMLSKKGVEVLKHPDASAPKRYLNLSAMGNYPHHEDDDNDLNDISRPATRPATRTMSSTRGKFTSVATSTWRPKSTICTADHSVPNIDYTEGSSFQITSIAKIQDRTHPMSRKESGLYAKRQQAKYLKQDLGVRKQLRTEYEKSEEANQQNRISAMLAPSTIIRSTNTSSAIFYDYFNTTPFVRSHIRRTEREDFARKREAVDTRRRQYVEKRIIIADEAIHAKESIQELAVETKKRHKEHIERKVEDVRANNLYRVAYRAWERNQSSERKQNIQMSKTLSSKLELMGRQLQKLEIDNCESMRMKDVKSAASLIRGQVEEGLLITAQRRRECREANKSAIKIHREVVSRALSEQDTERISRIKKCRNNMKRDKEMKRPRTSMHLTQIICSQSDREYGDRPQTSM